ncbi:hypothetical protein BJ166DRAFT_20776 [Pestalotiopsis sp. NC0098]|nr:hypothetical protein BJ166DRAFT_20776 [Pestalotiopsis sp. NC0098]
MSLHLLFFPSPSLPLPAPSNSQTPSGSCHKRNFRFSRYPVRAYWFHTTFPNPPKLVIHSLFYTTGSEYNFFSPSQFQYYPSGPILFGASLPPFPLRQTFYSCLRSSSPPSSRSAYTLHTCVYCCRRLSHAQVGIFSWVTPIRCCCCLLPYSPFWHGAHA